MAILEINESGNIFLFSSKKVLEKVNFSTVSKLFDYSICFLWHNEIYHDDILVFVSGTVPYMIKTETVIKALYSKLVHVTCLAHDLHKVEDDLMKSTSL